MTKLSEAMHVLIQEDVVEALEMDLLSNLETSVTNDLVTLLTDGDSSNFCDFVQATFIHANQNKRILTQLSELFELANFSYDIGESFLRVYKTNLEMQYHHKISKMAKDFYLQAFPSSTEDGDVSFGK